MSLREKARIRREEEQEILKKMAEGVEEASEDAAAAGADASAAPESPASAEKPADEASAGPSYTPMTDEQIRKVRLILWPILLVIAILVYFLMRSCKG